MIIKSYTKRELAKILYDYFAKRTPMTQEGLMHLWKSDLISLMNYVMNNDTRWLNDSVDMYRWKATVK